MSKRGKYYAKRILWYGITFIFALALNFFLPRMIDGNPVAVIAGKVTAGMSDTDRMKQVYEQFEKEFGMDKSKPVQFINYLGKLVKGDMGTSFSQYPRPVSEIVGRSLPWTIYLQLPGILIGWLLGNVLGAVVAYKKGIYQSVLFPVTLFVSAVPVYIMSVMLLYAMSISLGWFPTGGAYGFDMLPSFTPVFLASIVKHHFLPFLAIVLVTIGGQAIGMRSMVIYELNTDYVNYSKLMGIGDGKIVRYVFKNAMLPQITGLALSLGTMITGNLICEIVFSYPGLGTAMFGAIRQMDFPLISGCTLLITIAVLLANLLLEFIYALVDPRIRAQQEEGK